MLTALSQFSLLHAPPISYSEHSVLNAQAWVSSDPRWMTLLDESLKPAWQPFEGAKRGRGAIRSREDACSSHSCAHTFPQPHPLRTPATQAESLLSGFWKQYRWPNGKRYLTIPANNLRSVARLSTAAVKRNIGCAGKYRYQSSTD